MFWAAFSIGLIGGMHCTVMCTPLMLGVFRNKKQAITFVAYQTGRITMYVILGIVLALFGEGLELLGWQNALSITMAILIVYFYVLPAKYRFLNQVNQWENYPYQWLKSSFRKFLGRKDVASRFLIGMLNGLLPCGLVYMALLSSVAVDSIGYSAIFMLVFGLGTVPWIFGSVWIGKFTLNHFSTIIKKIKPVLAFSLALFLLLRGLQVQFIHVPVPDFGQQHTSIEIPICGGN